jgi:aspartate kinase
MFGRARITCVDSKRVKDMLANNVLVVVAGFQGVDVQGGDVTTLGRGGSDTTAVALAAALDAEICEIYTDVDGVFTADPNVENKACKLNKVSYEEMLEMASLGAKVLDIRSVALAAKFGVHVHVRSTFSDKEGTMVVPEKLIDEKLMVSGVTYSKNDARIRLAGVPDQPGTAFKLFSPNAQAGIVVDVIVQNISEEGYTDMTFTVPKVDFERTIDLVNNQVLNQFKKGKVEVDPNIAKVSVVGIGMRNHSGVATKMFSTLARENINIQLITTSEIKISCVIEEKYAELAVRCLHEAFGLDQANPPVAEAPV